MSKSYSEKLRDPRWQKRRLEILKRGEFRCALCVNSENELHVHHLVYRRGLDPWDYDDILLVPLCVCCHKKVAEMQDSIATLMAELPVKYLFFLEAALHNILHNHSARMIERFRSWTISTFSKRDQKKFKEE